MKFCTTPAHTAHNKTGMGSVLPCQNAILVCPLLLSRKVNGCFGQNLEKVVEFTSL